MNTEPLLQSRLRLFAENTQRMRGTFIWESMLMKRLAALLYVNENRTMDAAAVRECRELIKERTGLFSSFRGNMQLCLAAMLSMAPDKETQLDRTLAVYDRMKDAGFKASDFLVAAAYQVAARTDPAAYDDTVERARTFYEAMKKRHFFLTGRDDYMFAALLGISSLDIESGDADMAWFYSELKPVFRPRQGLQALSQVLALGGDREELKSRVLELHRAFLSRGIRMDKEYTLSSLGVLSLLPTSVESLAGDAAAAFASLRQEKGFGIWSIGKQELLLLASAVVASVHVDEAKSGIVSTAVSTSLTNLLIAQQMAAAGAAAAAASAAAASSSSS